MKTQKQRAVMDIVKASRRKSREEEIAAYGKPLSFRKVISSKKVYNRKRNKAGDENLPYLFLNLAY